jgi:HAMP domain-containing protein
MTDHGELRRLAEAAREVAPGEWRGTISDDGCGEQHEIVDGDGETVVGLIWYDGPQLMMGDEIKAHITAASPATVLALLDERDRLLRVVDNTVEERDTAQLRAETLVAECQQYLHLLKRCEWEAGGWCPICRERMNHGHAPDCELARALRGEG